MSNAPFIVPAHDLRKMNVGYFLITTLIMPLLRCFGKLEVVGKENIPSEGAILVANHVGWLDPLWLGVAVWPRPIYPMAKSELFKNRMFGWLIARMGAFPVNRDTPGPSALKLPLQIVQRGGLVAIFPGGRRSTDLTEIKRGAATIAVLANCPVLVVHYQGPSKLRLADLFRRPPVLVNCAPPLRPAIVELTPASRKNAIASISDAIKSSLEEPFTQPRTTIDLDDGSSPSETE